MPARPASRPLLRVPAISAGALLLDFGGVLWDMRWDVARELSEAHGLPRSSVFETLYRTETWHQIERGRGEVASWLAEAHRALEARAGRSLPPLHEQWRAAQGLIPGTVDLVARLRSRYKISVLSNADRSLRRRMEEEMRVAHLFDDIVCSAEVGMAKPETAVFLLAAERLGVPPERCVFVDDWDENVEAARRTGMRAMVHRADRGDDLRAQLATLGIHLEPGFPPEHGSTSLRGT